MSLVCETPGRPLLLAKSEDHHLAVLFRPRCKMWACPACAEINKRMWIAKVGYGAAELLQNEQELRMITLTSHERLTPSGSLAIFQDAWPKLARRARRRQNGFAYIMIPERQANGRLHAHALSNGRLGTRFWKDNGRACGLGFMNEEEPVRDLWRAAFYANKYLNKETAQTAWPKGFRRVRRSRNWPRAPDWVPPGDWGFTFVEWDRALADEASRLEARGYSVLLLNHAEAWDCINLLEDTLSPDGGH